MIGQFVKTIVAKIDSGITAGWSEYVSLPVDYALESICLFLKLKGKVSSAHPDPEAPASIIGDIEIALDGQKPIHADAEMLTMLEKITHAYEPVSWIETADKAQATDIAHCEIEVPLASYGLNPAKASCLWPGQVKSASIRLYWNADAALGAGYTITDATCDVYAKQYLHEQLPANIQPCRRLLTSESLAVSQSESARVYKLPRDRFLQLALVKGELNGLLTAGIVERMTVKASDKVSIADNINAEMANAQVKKVLALPFNIPDGYIAFLFDDGSGRWGDLFSTYSYPEAKFELKLNWSADSTAVKVLLAGVEHLPGVRR